MSAYPEDEYLALSGIQHFAFCPRQWALGHIECLWVGNLLTAEGDLLHERVHDPTFDEKRGDRLIVRAMPVASATLGIRGVCDVVEFLCDENGVPVTGRKGRWRPVPVEYKHGDNSSVHADSMQLCAQAMCLEEMLCCDIPEAYLYYAAVKRRERVELTPELRAAVRDALAEMHRLYARGHTPRVKKRPGCRSCAMREVCLPGLEKARSAVEYIRGAIDACREEKP
ncbi:MAG: PD-(D/E)XK nuclease superfamily protein [Firmicutes bacterium ADurb.Bin248]|nr:MAG: PD-(D/E)XK nuclease superfamily protein [Firmicutes bacterium ADurb.Bin248]HOG00280.1 CRISPR-associated protein Cas4 [Clostridia bacterium]HPK16233.1 CRISPR-associated protein Cas4 [Clostridia bacterium]